MATSPKARTILRRARDWRKAVRRRHVEMLPAARGNDKAFVAVMLLSFTAADEDGTAISLAMRDFVGIDLGPKTVKPEPPRRLRRSVIADGRATGDSEEIAAPGADLLEA